MNMVERLMPNYNPHVVIPEPRTFADYFTPVSFLFLAILATGPRSVTEQQYMGNLFRQEVGSAMVVRSEKSIDVREDANLLVAAHELYQFYPL